MNVRLTTLPMMAVAPEYSSNPHYTYTGIQNDSINYNNVSEDISSHNTSDYGSLHDKIRVVTDTFSFVISFIGLVGNGIVIWFLGVHIGKNPFITYILNLAIADFGLLVALITLTSRKWLVTLYGFTTFFSTLSNILFLSMYSASQFLLTVISIDRCVAVFFPLWHKCHQPPCMSTVVCAVIWVLSFLLSAMSCSNLNINQDHMMVQLVYQLIVNAVLCLPLMIITTVALSIKVCFIARKRKGKPLTTILLALLFFLLFDFPMNIIHILYIYHYVPWYISALAITLSGINSSVNPVIYFLVGRQWRSGKRETMKTILQRIFKEE